MTEIEDPVKIDVYCAAISASRKSDAEMTGEKTLTEEKEIHYQQNGLIKQKKSNIQISFIIQAPGQEDISIG